MSMWRWRYLTTQLPHQSSIWSAPAERSGDGAMDSVEDGPVDMMDQVDCPLSPSSPSRPPDPKRRRRFALPAHSKKEIPLCSKAQSWQSTSLHPLKHPYVPSQRCVRFRVKDLRVIAI